MRNVFVAVVCLASAQLDAATYFVDYASGDDANGGTAASSAWKHCPGDPAASGRAADAALRAGDTVLFKGGVTYVFTGATGIALRWDGASGKPIVYDGNSAGAWGSGRATFTDRHGSRSIVAFSSAAPRRHLRFTHLEFAKIGGAAALPADTGIPAPARFGGAIAFAGGANDVAIERCVFRELGYWFSRRPMNAASVAGVAVSSKASRGLQIARCEFSRVAIACDFSDAAELENVEIADCTFTGAIVWPMRLPLGQEHRVTVRGCEERDGAKFDFAAWAGYGPSPRVGVKVLSAGSPLEMNASAFASPAPTFRWFRNGVAIPGATGAKLSLPAVTMLDAGIYTVVATNSAGSAPSNAVVLAVTPRFSQPSTPAPAPPAPPASIPPTVSVQPAHQLVAPLTSATFTATVTGTPAPALQWRKNGNAIAGATQAKLVIASAAASDAATYTVVATNSAGTSTSNQAVLAVSAPPPPPPSPPPAAPAADAPEIVAGPGRKLIAVNGKVEKFTFQVGGSGPRRVIVRAVGPSLPALGISGGLADPTLAVFAGSRLLSANDNWGGSSIFTDLFNTVGAFPLPNPASKDAVLFAGLLPGTYTAAVAGVAGATGVVLIEVFELP